MRKTIMAVFSLLIVTSLLISGCAKPTPTPVPQATAAPAATTAPTKEAAATEVPTKEAASEPTKAPESTAFKVGQVTDTGGIDDKSFNATAWKGLELAADELGVQAQYLESQQLTDYAKNITEFLQQDYDLIITVGFLLGDDTAKFAQENPDVPFAIVDYAYDPVMPNVLGLTFSTDQAAFMAGYLAAGMTKTGKIGTFGGMEIPPVTIFMVGYEAGAKYYNQVHGTSVEVLGTDFYVGNFESTDDGRRAGESLMDEGCDIIMPVAGPVGEGTAAAVQERGAMVIGVDTDWTFSMPRYSDSILTSVLKNMDLAVFETTKQVVEGTFVGGTYVGTLANNGVGLAPYGAYDSQVPQSLKAELTDIRAELIAGDLWTGWGTAPETVDTANILGEDVTITFWHTQAPDSFRGGLMDEIVQAFMAEYPEITVESVYQGSYTDLNKKIMASIAAGEAPDCSVAYPSEIADYLKADAVVALDDYMADPVIGLSDADMADIFAGYLTEGRFPQYGNKYYAFPFTKSAVGMWYNLDLIKAAGFDAAPKTWAEFEEQCLAIAEMTGKPAYGYYESASTFDAWLYSRGATQLNADQTEAIFNGPEAVEAVDMMIRLIDAGAAYKPEGSYADQSEFGAGNIAFTMASTSGTFYYRQAVEGSGNVVKEWGQTIIPQTDPENPKTVIYGASFAVFKTTEAKQKASWLFAKFFTDTKQTADWGSGSGYMPVRASAAALLEDFFANDPIAKEQFDFIVPNGDPEPNVRGEQDIRTFIEDALVKAFEGIAEPQEALDEAVELANAALAAGRE